MTPHSRTIKRAALVSALAVGVPLAATTEASAAPDPKGPCQFVADATTVKVDFINDTGESGTAVNNRATGALQALSSWNGTNAPALDAGASTFQGKIFMHYSSNKYTNHGVTEWPAGCNPNYPWSAVNIHLTASLNQPAATWHHTSAHEYGHALGLDHNGAPGNNIMGASPAQPGWVSNQCNNCRTTPSGDDVAGINSVYK